MNGKITLITAPDFFENNNKSILFIHLSDEDQDSVSRWLALHPIVDNINLYVYHGEPNVPWLMYALSRCDYKYADLDGLNYITSALSGYMLGKYEFYYKTVDVNVAAVYSHINNNKINRIEHFLEKVFGNETN
jgi:hypothetical protein